MITVCVANTADILRELTKEPLELLRSMSSVAWP